VTTKAYVDCPNWRVFPTSPLLPLLISVTIANSLCSYNATKPTGVSAYKPVATAGAGKTVAFSGAALALAMGVAALL
jgi:hypothetical protein